VLIIAPPMWDVDDEADDYDDYGVEVHDEITGHYCVKCERLTALHLNTTP